MTGSGERTLSTTMAFVRMLSKLMEDPELGRYVVPIVPDEARTFGMEALFRKAGIYSSERQKYRPVDSSTLMPYREAVDGQILQEGICEAGAMASLWQLGPLMRCTGCQPSLFMCSIRSSAFSALAT